MSVRSLVGEKEWRYRKENLEIGGRLSKGLDCASLTGRLLAARGFMGIEEAYGFLHPELRGLHDPFLMNGMESTVERIGRAILGREKVLVHGDYDADGITSTALLVKALLSSMGRDRVSHFLPSRYGEGYGVSMERLDAAEKEGFDLVITVDCGIKAIEAADKARDLGIDLILTDHHEPGEELPRAFSILDPKIKGSSYPFRDLAGVGVSFKLALALQQKELLLMDARDLLGLVAFGTVADLVPLLGENRILVKHGLEILRNTRSPGMVSLMTESGIDLSKGISASDIAFKLGPRINSAGRMGDPTMALDLLLTDDRVDADLFARELNNLNFKRKAVGSKLVQEIGRTIGEIGADEDPFIVVSGEDWNPGVLGISANRIMDSLARPVAVLSIQKGIARGSVRAPEGFDLVKALDSVKDLCMEYGGHERAAGVTLSSDLLNELRSRLVDHTRVSYPDLSFIPSLMIDMSLNIDELDLNELKDLEKLEPFGTGNPTPMVSIREIMVGGERRTVGDGKHLRMTIEDGSSRVQCIYFNGGQLMDKLHTGMIISVVGEPSVHRWGGKESVQLRLVDIKCEEPC